MRVWIARNATADTESLRVFKFKNEAIQWLKNQGLVKKGEMWMYPEQDITDIDEYMYWLERHNIWVKKK